MTYQVNHNPHMYFYRGSRTTDLPWINGQLSKIPEEEQKRVCDKYANIFLSVKGGARREANEYLHSEASRFSPHEEAA